MKNMTKEVKSNLQFNRIEETGLSLIRKTWLTGDEVIHLLGISKRTLQNYRDQRKLPFSQVGRKIYYKASDIEEYLSNHYIRAYYQRGGVA
jgi:excisionase family DNA binding protein